MMDVFSHWREQEWQSTMQKMAIENVRLRRTANTSRIVALAVWVIVVWIAAYQFGIWIAERIQL